VRRSKPLVAAGLAALVLAAFWGVLDCGFVAFDDDLYVTDNRWVRAGLGLRGLAWAFTSFQAGNWHPLTWLSHMLDVSLFGVAPAGHHATSLVLHAVAAVLAFGALAELTGSTWRAALAAALFALHPLRLESVAWIAERKDVLCGCFALAALWSWARWARSGTRRAWWGSLALFAAALASKPMAVTLPFLFLVLDAWPLGRLSSVGELGARVREKLPFFALSAASCAVTLTAQASGIVRVPLGQRLANAAVAPTEYLWRVVDPRELSVIYPFHPLQGRLVLASLLLLGALATIAWTQRRARPWLAVGGLWFLGMLVPTLGLVQVGAQAFADRYTYLPSLGLALALAWELGALAARVPFGRVLAGAVAALLLTGCVVQTRAQVPVWHDTVSLFENAIVVTHSNWFAHTELGIAYAARGGPGDLKRARAQLENAVRTRSDYPRALANLGRLEAETGEPQAGATLLERALGLEPGLAGGRFAYASALERAGRFADAEAQYRLALADPRGARDAALRLARLLAALPDPALRNGAEAQALCDRSCAESPCDSPQELDVCAMAAMEAGRTDAAVLQARRALALAQARGDAALAEAIQARLTRYGHGEPYRLAPTPSGVVPPR
jgi:tetratricopeptide (TPR) repeat protein